MANRSETISPEAINEFRVISNDRTQKQQLEIAIMNDPEFPDLIKSNQVAMWDFDQLYWSESDLYGSQGDLTRFIKYVIDGIVESGPVTKAQLFEARSQLIRVFNKVLLARLRLRNVEALNKTFGKPYTSDTVGQLPQNSVFEIQKFLSGKTPNKPTRENARAGRSYNVMTQSVVRQLRNNFTKGGSRKTRKIRKLRKTSKQ